jgi:hypothetical protein
MTNETESHGVNVWMCATIYVDAFSQEEAESTVTELYAGSLENPDTVEIAARDIRMSEGGDFLSPAVTLYGLASESKLVPEFDPVRDAAPDMLAALQAVMRCARGELERPLTQRQPWAEAQRLIEAAIAKAEGGAAPTTLETAQSLEAKYGRWQDHPDYSDRDWRNDETRLGYWEWVASKVNSQEGDSA